MFDKWLAGVSLQWEQVDSCWNRVVMWLADDLALRICCLYKQQCLNSLMNCCFMFDWDATIAK